MKSKYSLIHKVATCGVLAFACYIVLGYLIVPLVITKVVPDLVSEKINGSLTIGHAKFNPFNFFFTMEDVDLKDSTGESVVRLDKLRINYDAYTLFMGRITFRELILTGPYVKASLNKEGVLNLQTLAKASEAIVEDEVVEEPEDANKLFTLPPLDVLVLRVQKGAIKFEDNANAEHFTREIKNLSFEITNFSTDPIAKNEPSFYCVTENGTELSWKGTLLFNPLSSTGTVKLSNFQPGTYSAYYQSLFNARLESCSIGTELKYRFMPAAEVPEMRIHDSSVSLDKIVLTAPTEKQPFKSLDKIGFDGINLDFIAGTALIEHIFLDGGSMHVIRSKDNSLNLTEHFASRQTAQKEDEQVEVPKTETAPSEVIPKPLKRPRDIIGAIESTLNWIEMLPHLDWQAEIGKFSIQNQTIEWVDNSLTTPMSVTVKSFDFELENISNKKDSVSNLLASLEVEEGGRIDLSGSVKATPGAYDLKFKVDQLNIAAASPYLEDANMQVESGLFSLKGTAKAVFDEETGKPEVDVTADASLAGVSFALNNLRVKSGMFNLKSKVKTVLNKDAGTCDADLAADVSWSEASVFHNNLLVESDLLNLTSTAKARLSEDTSKLDLDVVGDLSLSEVDLSYVADDVKDRFFGWEDLLVKGISFSLEPMSVSVDEIALSQPRSIVKLEKDGTLSLMKLVPEKSEEKDLEAVADDKKVDEEQAETIKVEVGKISIKGGEVSFADESIDPAYTTAFSEINLDLAGISSLMDKKLTIDFSAKGRDGAILNATSELDNLAGSPDINAKITTSFLSLSQFSPYTKIFIGYPLSKGKLNVVQEYKVVSNKLDGKIDILVDNIELGDFEDGEKVVNLPLKLGLALLKDREGKIGLPDLELHGQLDDPEFSIGKLIWYTVSNIFIKAASSPFTFLASSFGSDEDISGIDFEPGKNVFVEDHTSRLETLAEILSARPTLLLEIHPAVNIEIETAVVLNELLSKRLDEYREELLRQNTSSGSEASVSVQEMTRNDLIASLYMKLFPNAGNTREGTLNEVIIEESAIPLQIATEEMVRKLLTLQSVPDGYWTELAESRGKAILAFMSEKESVSSDRFEVSINDLDNVEAQRAGAYFELK